MSKSVLFLFVRQLMSACPDISYFPSYEIFMDDLRDYRFYDTDMMHPGSAGVDYVWNRFTEACIDPAVYPVMEEVESLVKAVSHQSAGFRTEAHKRFVLQQIDRIESIMHRNPGLDFRDELDVLRDRLGSDQS